MTANLRRAAEAMRKEGDPFHDAVADWLDLTAATHESDPTDYCAGEGHPIDDEDAEVPCGSWWCWSVYRAEVVASAYLSDPGDVPAGAE